MDDHLDELAHHYERSTNADKAVHYLGLAAHRTAQQGLLAEGKAQAGRALKVLATLPDTPERAQNELDLLIELALAEGLHAIAEACAWRGELTRACEAARAEVELCTRYGLRSMLVAIGSALATPRLGARVA